MSSPARSFAPNAAGYDPHYHYQMAIDAGLKSIPVTSTPRSASGTAYRPGPQPKSATRRPGASENRSAIQAAASDMGPTAAMRPSRISTVAFLKVPAGPSVWTWPPVMATVSAWAEAIAHHWRGLGGEGGEGGWGGGGVF